MFYCIINNFKCEISGSPISPRNIDLQTHGSRNPEGYFWHLISREYFQSRISPRFCFNIPNPELQVRKIPDPEKPTGVHQILKTPNIICYLALYIDIDSVLHVYICNRLQFLEISGSEYSKYHRSRNIIHESAKIFAFSRIKTQLKLWLIISKIEK